MNASYRNAIATHGATLLTHIGLVNNLGVELSGGTPAYARRAVAWTAPSNGIMRPTLDLVFDIPAGAIVAGWRAYTAITGGTDHGGAALTATPSYPQQGQYRLLAASSGVEHNAG